MQLLPYKRQKLFLSLEALSFGTLPVGTAAEQLIVVYSTSHVRQRTRIDAPTRLEAKRRIGGRRLNRRIAGRYLQSLPRPELFGCAGEAAAVRVDCERRAAGGDADDRASHGCRGQGIARGSHAAVVCMRAICCNGARMCA